MSVLQALGDDDWRIWPVGYGERLSGGAWWAEPHLELLGAEIVQTVTSGGRLIVTEPPRHGKSELVDVYTPAWFLDLWPHKRVMITTYGDQFAAEWGLKVRDVINANLELTRVRIRQDSSAKNRWRTNEGGGLVAAGVGGQITGRGADLLIIDDPHKNWEEANSQVYRDKVWNWWLSTARTRLEPDAAVIVVMTRWHEDDFVGRMLQAPGGERWKVINLPAFAEPGDLLGRDVGTPLWPSRYDTAALEELRDTLGPYMFGAMFQQHPSAPEGSILKRQWWKRYTGLPPQVDQWLGSWDMAFSDNDESSYVVGQIWARAGARKYLVWQTRGHWDYPETRRRFRQLAMEWPRVNEWIVEAKANGPAIIADLSGEIAGINGYSPRDSKEARAHASAPTLAAGNVFVPLDGMVWDQDDEHATATTPADVIDECAQFPHGANDDIVDTFTQAMLHMGVGSPILTGKTYKDDRLIGRR